MGDRTPTAEARAAAEALVLPLLELWMHDYRKDPGQFWPRTLKALAHAFDSYAHRIEAARAEAVFERCKELARAIKHPNHEAYYWDGADKPPRARFYQHAHAVAWQQSGHAVARAIEAEQERWRGLRT